MSLPPGGQTSLEALRRACDRADAAAADFSRLGDALARQRLFPEAAIAFERAVRLEPGNAELRRLLGWAHHFRGDPLAAAEAFRSALALAPADAGSHIGLSASLRVSQQLAGAFEHAAQAAKLQPENPQTHFALGLAAAPLGELELTEQSLRRAAAAGYAPVNTLSTQLLLLHHRHGNDAAYMFQEHREWGRRFTDAVTPLSNNHDRRPGSGPLRIGYLSPDFRTHAVANFFEPVLNGHDRTRVQVTLYHSSPHEDEVTRRLRSAAAQFRSVHQVQDEPLAEMIHRDALDVLVDLAGHTAGARPMVIARRPAPLIVNYIGYPNTTGMRQSDRRVTDAWHAPAGEADRFHTEQLHRIDGGAWAWRPYDAAPPVTPSPVEHNDYVTFYSPNAWPKVTDSMLGLWRQILEKLPRSRLMIMTGDPAYCRERVMQTLGGVDPQRVELLGRMSVPEYLASYGRADVVLDTFPFAGHTTTCDALWQGCPVVTLAGATHVARAGVSVLSAAGWGEWVAYTPEAYVRIACDLGTNAERLGRIRRSIRDQLQASPLTDGRRVAAALEREWGLALSR